MWCFTVYAPEFLKNNTVFSCIWKSDENCTIWISIIFPLQKNGCVGWKQKKKSFLIRHGVPRNLLHSWNQHHIEYTPNQCSDVPANLCTLVPVPVPVSVLVSANRCYASNFVELCNRIQMKYLNASLHIFSHAYISIYWLVYFYNYYHFCLLAREARDFHLPFRCYSLPSDHHIPPAFSLCRSPYTSIVYWFLCYVFFSSVVFYKRCLHYIYTERDR